jgi:hypothetical protein
MFSLWVLAKDNEVIIKQEILIGKRYVSAALNLE